jgi:hypothetical protein
MGVKGLRQIASNHREWKKNANRWTRGDWNYSNVSNRHSARGDSFWQHIFIKLSNILQKILASISHNVPAVWDGLQPCQNVAKVLRGNERSE